MANRHQFRANWHDYNGGVYFVTICSHNKQFLFGTIANCKMYYSPLGLMVEEHIKLLSEYHQGLILWNHVVMPNHIHLVLEVGTRLIASTSNKSGCLKPPKHGEPCSDNHHNARLSTIIGAFKAGITRNARTRLLANIPCWQTRYHEHIIRNQHSYDNIMKYVSENVENWDKDCFYID